MLLRASCCGDCTVFAAVLWLSRLLNKTALALPAARSSTAGACAAAAAHQQPAVAHQFLRCRPAAALSMRGWHRCTARSVAKSGVTWSAVSPLTA